MIGCEDRLRNDQYCVGWGVKLYSNHTKPATPLSRISAVGVNRSRRAYDRGTSDDPSRVVVSVRASEASGSAACLDHSLASLAPASTQINNDRGHLSIARINDCSQHIAELIRTSRPS